MTKAAIHAKAGAPPRKPPLNPLVAQWLAANGAKGGRARSAAKAAAARANVWKRWHGDGKRPVKVAGKAGGK